MLIILSLFVGCKGNKRASWTNEFINIFNNVVITPNIETLMPDVVVENGISTDYVKVNNSKNLSNKSFDLFEYIKTDSLSTEGFVYNEFQTLLQTYENARDSGDLYKQNLLDIVNSQTFGVNKELNTWYSDYDGVFSMFEQTNDKLGVNIHNEYSNNTISDISIYVYNDNTTTVFSNYVSQGVTIRQYYYLNNENEFVFIEELTYLDELQIRGFALDNSSDIFSGIVFSFVHEENESQLNNRIIYMTAKEDEFLQYEKINLNTNDEYYRMLLINDEYSLIANFDDVSDNQTISVNINAFDGLDGLYYENNDNNLLTKGFKASNKDFVNTYKEEDVEYGLMSGITTFYIDDDKIYAGFITLSGEFNPDNLKDYFVEELLFLDIDFKYSENKSLGNTNLNNYTLRQISSVDDMIIIDNISEFSNKITEFLDTLTFTIS